MRAIVLFFLLAGMVSIPAYVQANQEKPQKLNVLSTIKPVQALVLAIAGEQINSHQLIPDYASAHFYTFKPSDLRKIKRAGIIFRIDESMEMRLAPAFENASSKTKIISLSGAPGVKLIPVSKQPSSHKGHEPHDAHRQRMDMHIWTSPHNAIAMARKIAGVLAGADPENKTHYNVNLQQLIRKIKDTALTIEAELKTVKNKPYIVFHDSWRYFSQYFGLHKSTLVSLHEGIAPGARTLPKIRKQIKTENIHCVFTKPGMNPAWIDTLTENMENVKALEIDVIASTLAMSDEMYIDWLGHMGKQIQRCLTMK